MGYIKRLPEIILEFLRRVIVKSASHLLFLVTAMLSMPAFASSAKSLWCSGASSSSDEIWLDLDAKGNGTYALTYTNSYIDSGSGLKTYDKSALDDLRCSFAGGFNVSCVLNSNPDVKVELKGQDRTSLDIFAPGFPNFDAGTYDGVQRPFQATFSSCHVK